MRTYVDVLPGLWSMGAAYRGEFSPTYEDLDPEMTVLKTLKCMWAENDVFEMMMCLLKLRIGKLIHVERLVKLANSGFLSEDEKCLLIGISTILTNDGDLRYRLVRKKLFKKGMKINKLPELWGNPKGVKVWGAEESLLEFGAEIRKFDYSDKKLRDLKTIFERNGWLKLRALIGANYRADITFLVSSGAATTVNQAAKIAGCNSPAAYRLFEYARVFDNLGKLLSIN